MTKVLFRKDSWGVTACFPEDMSCYSRIGQHSTYSRDWYRQTRPASPEEYRALKRELESYPYEYQLEIIHRHPR